MSSVLLVGIRGMVRNHSTIQLGDFGFISVAICQANFSSAPDAFLDTLLAIVRSGEGQC